jgi:hypothetical protein
VFRDSQTQGDHFPRYANLNKEPLRSMMEEEWELGKEFCGWRMVAKDLSTCTKELNLPETRQFIEMQAKISKGQASEACCPKLQ